MYELVVGARHLDLVAPRRLEPASHVMAGRQRDLLLVDAAIADRAGVDAAMTGVEHDQVRLAAARRNLFGKGLRRHAEARHPQYGAAEKAQQTTPVQSCFSHGYPRPLARSREEVERLPRSTICDG